MSPHGRMRPVNTSRFAMVPRNEIPRSAFDVQHLHKTSFISAALIPIYVDEVLPGDSLRLNMTAFARTATMIVPVMDNITLETFFFFCPSRLLWDKFERFMGEQLTPADVTVYLLPQVTLTPALLLVGGIADYMGLTNNGSANNILVNALPFRAYNKIYNDWFRDQDLITPVVENVGDGPDVGTDYNLRFRAKQHDYFTSARPWPLKPINMNIASTLDGAARQGGPFDMQGQKVGAPVTGIGVVPGGVTAVTAGPFQETGARSQTYPFQYNPSQTRFRTHGVDGTLDIKVMVEDMRTAIMIQHMFETNARGGTRYAELVQSHFGVRNPDSRLQRPELLGGGRSMISVQPVQQQSATGITGSTTVKGDLAGAGTAVMTRHGFSSSFTEHGYIIGLVNAKPDLTYQQGVERMWWRRTQYDHYWPGLAHLGEQAILKRELFADGAAADTEVFGYQERWAEYKYKPSRTSGYFRSTVATPLDMWHYGEEFSARPVLNQTFIEQQYAPLNRALTVPGYFSQQILLDALFDCRWVRAMPMHSIPGIGAKL